MSDSEDEITEKQFKIVLVGDPQCGKTQMANKYSSEGFTKQYVPTVGVEFYLKRTVLPGPRHVALKLWDVGGSALEGRMLDKYIFGADAILLVYDVANYNSFENLEDWLLQCHRILKAGQQAAADSAGEGSSASSASSSGKRSPAFALVANKIDLEHLRTVKSDRHHKFAQENGLLTYAVSAKSGEGINLCFQKVSAELLGIKLSKVDQEQQQAVVKAEIVTYRQDRVQANTQGNVKSSMCSLQ